ncbi:Uu.00g139100.m01.CDS01 [Anthostomella pinea]|uniref:Uu.00g139100.m01.CDS01 n=1 Tax=Anthostomella pinea TaxID=933095 RepID=A0AAI8YLA1_9PEZI|nr:Uu.00g139100.m01.CDS01 [Anthostomella pinea]
MGSTTPNRFGAPRPDPTLHLPRILCLHGGGTNARIFRAQCRVVQRMLEPYFHLAYAEAPFASAPGPDVVTVYANDGPFKRWLRWLPDHAPVDDASAIRALDDSLAQAMRDDDAAGATGPWVGLLGFSQGAKMGASLLFRQQVRVAKMGRVAAVAAAAGTEWKFAVLMAGRAPLVNLNPDVFQSSMLSDASEIGLSGQPDLMEMMSGQHVLRLPTIHVHGLADPGLHLHRELLEHYCDQETATVIEWDGAHRVPLKATDVQPMIGAILEVAKQTDVL